MGPGGGRHGRCSTQPARESAGGPRGGAGPRTARLRSHSPTRCVSAHPWPAVHHDKTALADSRRAPQHHSPPFPPRLQVLLTLFAKSFASFNHSTCALSVPCRYSSLRGIHLAVQAAVPSNSTLGCDRHTPRRTTGHTTCMGQVSRCREPFQGSSGPRGPRSMADRSATHSIEKSTVADRIALRPVRAGASCDTGGRIPVRAEPVCCRFTRRY